VGGSGGSGGVGGMGSVMGSRSGSRRSPFGSRCLPFGRRLRCGIRTITAEPPVDCNDTTGWIGKMPEQALAHVNTTVTRADLARVGDLRFGGLSLVFDGNLLEAHRARVHITKHGEVEGDNIVVRVVPDSTTTEPSLVPRSSGTSERLTASIEGHIASFALS